MPDLPAARVGDEIAHSHAALGTGLGFGLGLLAGVVLVGATIATGGAALAIAGAVGGALVMSSAGGFSGGYIGEAVMGPPCGNFVTGSPNVFINSLPATFTLGSIAACQKDSGPQPLATGAATVTINFGLAGRQDEKIACSAKSIAKTSPNVFIGGPSAQDPNVELTPEVPQWATTALTILGIAGAAIALPVSIMTLGTAVTVGGGILGAAGGALLTYGGRQLGEALGLPEAGIRALEVAGGMIGGALGGAAGMRGGKRFDYWRQTRGVPVANRVPYGIPLSQKKFSEILALPRAQRPLPETYLPKSYINKHLKKFDEGGSYLVRTKTLDDYGRDALGRPDGVFMMPKKEMDAVLARTGGDIAKIEKELGIPAGSWNRPGETLSRIDVPKPRDLDLRMPSGREAGANDDWMPGGKLPGGGSEAVVNQVPRGGYNETIIGGTP